MTNIHDALPCDTLPPRYALQLLSPGANRIQLLREIRTARPDLSLNAAKALLDGAPTIVKHELLRQDVEQLRRRFEVLAQVDIVQSDGTPLPQRLYETNPKRPTSTLIV